MIGWVDDRPIPRERLDQRIAGLRNGPLRSALPVPGTSEDRQLARWVTQVILTEALCEATAIRLGLRSDPSGSLPHPDAGPEQEPTEPKPELAEAGPEKTEPDPDRTEPARDRTEPEPEGTGPEETGSTMSILDRVAAVELGSINAAAYNGNPWVRAVFRQVTAKVTVPPEWRRTPSPEHTTRHLVRHRLFNDPVHAREVTEAELEPLGAVELDSLPSAIAEALRSHPYGTLVGPVKDALGWHVAVATLVESTPTPEAHDEPLVEAARRKAFARWLDDMRSRRVRLVPGLEHPGDPRQPDNHHKH
ncbi:peptidylprolyl isomerase [Nonomuraea aridisoli]|uniref:peptidylprolyl isomerase n=1 Tax=Nonomuraea aridisoli TaxID=2070368 RepID=UPI0011B93ED2|nr:hypothetical protein [Nonomuraea aridisoli]